MKRIIFLIICLLSYSASVFAADGEALEMIGRVMVGDFKLNSARVTDSMNAQLLNGISDLDVNDDTQVKIIAHTDKSGPVAYNRKLAQKRVESIEKALYDIFGKNYCCLETKAMVYEKNVNEVNRRYAVIEFWKQKKEEVKAIPTVTETPTEDQARENAVFQNAENAIEDHLLKMERLAEDQQAKEYDRLALEQRHFGIVMILGALLLIILVLVVFVIFLLLQRRRGIPINHLTAPRYAREPAPESRNIRIFSNILDDSGNAYNARCLHFVDAFGREHYISPFVYDSGELIDKESEEFMRISLSKCLSKAIFSKQKETLINQGYLEPIWNGG